MVLGHDYTTRRHANGNQWEYTEVQALLGRMRSALMDKNNHGYYEMLAHYFPLRSLSPASRIY